MPLVVELRFEVFAPLAGELGLRRRSPIDDTELFSLGAHAEPEGQLAAHGRYLVRVHLHTSLPACHHEESVLERDLARADRSPAGDGLRFRVIGRVGLGHGRVCVLQVLRDQRVQLLDLGRVLAGQVGRLVDVVLQVVQHEVVGEELTGAINTNQFPITLTHVGRRRAALAEAMREVAEDRVAVQLAGLR